jgi:hypothetical protein
MMCSRFRIVPPSGGASIVRLMQRLYKAGAPQQIRREVDR